MRLGTILILATLLVAPEVAQAGAWPREKGKIFASSSLFLTWPSGRKLELPDVYMSAYGEYGLGRNLTAGADFGTADMTSQTRYRAVAFLRYSLGAADAPNQYAIDVGGGMDLGKPVGRVGVSYGRGVRFGSNPGWVSLEGVALFTPQGGEHAITVDATFGLSRGPSKYMIQFSGHQGYDGNQVASATPSYVRNIFKNTHIEIGAVIGLKNKPDPALKIGIWQEF